jgi:hypothetical protein
VSDSRDLAEHLSQFERRIQMYQDLAGPDVREAGYDAILHEAVLDELSKRNPFFRWTGDELTEDSFDEAFSDPEALATALMSFEVFRLIITVWPNARSGHRSVPITWEESSDWWDMSEDQDGSHINATPDSGGPWHIPKMLDYLHPEFLPRAFDLMLELETNEMESAWPISRLYSSPFTLLWEAFGQIFHDQNPKYPVYSPEKRHELFDLTQNS